MTRLALLTLLLLSSCIPAYSDATPEQLRLTQEGSTYALESDAPILRGSIGVRAARVESPYCVPVSCQKDVEGRVLLRLEEGPSYGMSVLLGQIEGLERARLVIVRVDEDEALTRTFGE